MIVRRQLKIQASKVEQPQPTSYYYKILTKGRNQEPVISPNLYRICLVNRQDMSPCFVGYVLKKIFRFSELRVNFLIKQLSCYGYVECGSFTYEIAEQKLLEIKLLKQYHLQILDCIIEKR